jgi:RND family efflux transporter MFP subunit
MAAAWGCGAGGGGAPAASGGTEPGVRLVTVDTATVDVPVSLPAQLYVEHDALVYARTSGIVESIYVDLGSQVEAGQLLAHLEHVDQSIAMAHAEAAYDNARRVVERARELGKTRAIATADSEQAEADFQNAALTRQQAQRNYDLTRVTAPFAGVVTARAVRPRRLVAAGDSLFRVSALGPLRVSVHVPEGSGGRLGPGATGAVVGGDGTVVRATVIRASPAIDAASGTREVILQVAPGSALPPGASVTVRIATERRRVLVIPTDAIAEQGYVLVWENGRPALRAVSVGATLADGRLEIVSGLALAEQVVRAP